MTEHNLDQLYSPSHYADDFLATLASQAEAGAALRAERAPITLSYGENAYGDKADSDDWAARLHLFVPEHRSERTAPWPLMVFIHGGYWQELDHTATDFMARRYLDQGMAFASLGYGLAPRVSIETMVSQCRHGLRALMAQADELGLAPCPLLGGHSAGAHLACQVALAEAAGGDETSIDIAELLLVSGIYDLRPLVATYVNQPLGLDEARAGTLSPLLAELSRLPPVRLMVAEHDSPAFHRQAEDFAVALRAAGVNVGLEELPGCDHFDVLDRL